MGAMSRRKGATYEREIVKGLKAVGFNAERTSRGVVQADKGDIAGVRGLHIEAKRCERISLPAWIAQAERDCPEGSVPAVVFRRSGEPSRAVVPWGWLLGLLARLNEEGETDMNHRPPQLQPMPGSRLPDMSWTSQGNTVSVSDERQRTPGEVPPGTVASVTLDGGDESWGEFISKAEARALYAWLGLIIHA